MKKRSLVALFILLFAISLIYAAEDDVTLDSSTNTQDKVQAAYDCLNEQIDDCSKLSLQEVIFANLATGKCSSKLNTLSENSNECWPKSGCKIKETAQAILASNGNVKAEEWLLSHNSTPSELEWYLQIEADGETSCTVSYDGASHQITIGDDKKIRQSAGTCLTLSSGGWWLRINPSCYDREFEVSCNQDFLTSLLFRKTASSTYHVSDITNSRSAEGKTTEKVNSLCFATGNSCDYEGSLWAALVLDKEGYSVSPFLPYLIAMSENNNVLLPEAFLYLLTEQQDFRSSLLLKQKNNKYWDESQNGKFYDTALAMLAVKDNQGAKDWLFEIQDSDTGCWDSGNIVSNAFILYSVWGSKTEEPSSNDCESDADGYCMLEIDCEGNVLDGYDCSGFDVCCDTAPVLPLCIDDLDGEFCSAEEDCVGGYEEDASDTPSGMSCCVSGRCEVVQEESECEEFDIGTCKSFCGDDEEEANEYGCAELTDVCCKQKEDEGSLAWLWITLLVLLIILVILGIVFRDKLRPFWHRFKSKFSKGKPSPPPKPGQFQRPGIPVRPGPPGMPRRILPPMGRPMPRRLPPKSKGEMDDVLKKLKDLGK